jgi:iron complex transport system ATP-binding protein
MFNLANVPRTENVFELDKVSFKYNSTLILRNISLKIPQGRITGILGPNGSGKTTLLKILSGINKPSQGSVFLYNRLLETYSRKDLAKQIAFLEQNNSVSSPFTVREVVEMGRYPWLKPLSSLKARDKEIVDYALQCFDLTAKQDQTIGTMSGGEKQLVSLARAMAQEPQILILDEPTTYLDIGHQSMVMEYLYKWHKEWKTTIIMVIHDLNMLSQYCDHLIVLDNGVFVKDGVREEVLCKELITKTYKANFSVIKHPDSGVPQFLPYFNGRS